MPEITEHEVSQLVEPYVGRPAELIQALHRVQQALGHVPPVAQRVVARRLGVPLSQVRGVVTFYHFFRTQPVGRHIIRLCLGTACYVRGADRVLQALQEELGAELGGTSRDGLFTLEGVRCLGACGLAPVMTVDDAVYGRLTPGRAREILAEFRRG
ncbi:TPA: NADH-quinone oxidoreductase subunit NuoE [Candidatus Bipolaricaulota bacterium]|nr:NADH-quinone oxidoreductase subunit NuoE [Candidatus Bipolaricaulota bacterium]HIP99828.1 NADH-quinone oxidoreductase subunit NuoE [Candidatus Bipolaricaulota bacterium]